MSKVAIAASATGTGIVTLAAPITNTDRTIMLPDAAGTLTTSEAVTAAGFTTPAAVLTQFNATGAAPVYACRAWVNFNGTGTVAIRASGNVSSITDVATGIYTVNFTTAMPDTNYTQVTTAGNSLTGGVACIAPYNFTNTVSACNLSVFNSGYSAFLDANTLHVAIFR